jgi:putative pyrroloquinoline-quinone binding quinoprotein
MFTSSRIARLGTMAVTLAAVLVTLHPGAALADARGWPQYRGEASRPGSRIWGGAEPSGQIAWRRNVAEKFQNAAPPMVDASPVVAPGDGTIYVGMVAGMVRVSKGAWVSPSLVAYSFTGTLKWATRLDAAGYHYKVRATPAIRSDGSLVVVGYRSEARPNDKWGIKGRVFLVGAGGSVLRTSAEIDGAGLSSPLLIGNTAWVFSHPIYQDDVLWKIDANFTVTGFNAVHYDINGSCYCSYDPLIATSMYSDSVDPDVRELLPSPALDSVNSEIVQPSVRTVRIRTSNGTQVWDKNVMGYESGPIVAGASFMPANVGFEARKPNGDKAWSGSGSKGVAIGEKGLYASHYDGFLYAYTTGGQLRWKRTIGENGNVGPPTVLRIGSQDVIVVTGSQNQMFAYRSDGALAWVVQLDGPALGSPSVSDLQIYVTTQWSLYAIR